MQFKKFQEFLNERQYNGQIGIPNDRLNRGALDYDKKLAEFNGRFSDPSEGERIVKLAGYNNIREFLFDPDERKWSKLKIPGQENYVRPLQA